MDNREKLKNYLRNSEMDVQSARAAMLMGDLVFGAYAKSGEVTGINNYHIYYYAASGNSDVFYQLIGKDDIKKVSRKIYADYLKDHSSLKKKMDAHKELSRMMDDLWEEYSEKDEREISDKTLSEYFRKMAELMHDWWKFGAIGEDKAEVINWEVVSRFQKRKKMDHEEAREIVSTLAHPDEPAFFNQEREMFLKICLAVCHDADGSEKDRKIKHLVKKYIKNFFWIKTNFYEARRIDEDEVMKDFKKEIKTKGEDGIRKELQENRNNFAKIRKRKKEILKDYILDKEDQADIQFSQAVIRWFDQRKLGTMMHFYYVLTMLREIARRKRIAYHTCTLFFPEEIVALLEKNVRPDPIDFARREKSLFLDFAKGKRTAYFDDEARELFDTVMKNNGGKNLKGVVASRGGKEKIKGIVKIIIRPDKHGFENGKILVTSMTRIEFVPLMKKARAIITNEGGLACHAAIVSRELGLPAIIGTKNATEILKDGDEIEMDMKTGEIKIMK
jgi:phosphoenolpyruvate synthase/pyruvate phosphate dikinase